MLMDPHGGIPLILSSEPRTLAVNATTVADSSRALTSTVHSWHNPGYIGIMSYLPFRLD